MFCSHSLFFFRATSIACPPASAKELVLVLVSVAVFHDDTLTALNWTGMAVTVLGLAAYRFARTDAHSSGNHNRQQRAGRRKATGSGGKRLKMRGLRYTTMDDEYAPAARG